MVPAAFVRLEALPSTPNGKLDRRNLPEPRPSGIQFVEPQTALQRKLAEIWKNALGAERVGLEDDYFQLGGHSLLAARIVSEVNRALGKRIPIATLVQAPTVQKLATLLEAEGWKLSRSLLVAIQPYGSRPPFFAVHTLNGEAMFYRGLAARLGEDQPFYGIQSEGVSGGALTHRSIETIAHCYVSEIRRVQAQGPYYLGGYCIGGLIAFEMAQQLRAAGDEVACVVLIDPDRVPEPSSRPATLGKRIQVALDECTALPPGEKLRYFRRRIQGKVKGKLRRLHEAGSDFTRPLYQLFSQLAGKTPVPLEPGRSPVGRMLMRAQSKYLHRPYLGRIILFCAPDPGESPLDDGRGWTELAKAGLEIHEIPGEHQTVFDVPVLAEKLNACLRAAAAGQVASRSEPV